MIKVVFKVLSHLNRINQLVWRLKQPLTKKPSDPCSVVSDLFVWRKAQGFRTFFDLTDIASLFDQSTGPNLARVMIFDKSGGLVTVGHYEAPCYSRLQIDISELAAPCKDNVGTFCVLHPKTPRVISELGSYLAERGYVSYCYGESSLKSYVHGNLDAVSLTPTGAIELLAGTSFLKRKYRLQYELRKNEYYDLAVVNASTMEQLVRCNLYNTIAEVKTTEDAAITTKLRPESLCRQLETILKPGACHIFKVDSTMAKGPSLRAVIESHLVMLRPTVFHISKERIHVFHG